jgi:hypothetical protein
MYDRLGLELLNGRDDRLSAFIREIHGSTGEASKVVHTNRSSRHTSNAQSLYERRPEFLEKIERQRRSAWSQGMKEPDLWIEAYRFKCSDTLSRHEPTHKADQGIHSGLLEVGANARRSSSVALLDGCGSASP